MAKKVAILLLLTNIIVLAYAGCDGGCQNGGTCDGSVCKCADGYYGKKCNRPCQDVFKSCDRWKEEGRCDWDYLTNYYDIHCPHSCENCVYNNKTIVQYPIPPAMEPVQFFIGTWRSESSGPEHFPVDFQNGGYNEEIRIMAAAMPAFDRPCLNYTSIAVSKTDPNDIQYENGFMYAFRNDNETLVGIMQTGNTGLTVLQEGELKGFEVKLKTTYMSTYSTVDGDNTVASRILGVAGDLLYMIVTNSKQSYTKSYRKVKNLV